MSTVSIAEQSRCTWFRSRNQMKALVRELFQKEKQTLGELTIVLCDDEYLLTINQEFLQHNYYTDIITFDLGDAHSISGELYISIDRVADNAGSLGLNKLTELRRVIIHGCLHLCGYKDKLIKDQAIMRVKEELYLQLYSKRST